MFDRFYRQAEQAYPNAIEKLKFNEALKRILDRMVGDLIRTLQNQIKAAGICNLEDVRACPRRLAIFSSEVEEERRGTKEFLAVLRHKNVAGASLPRGRHRHGLAGIFTGCDEFE